MRIYISTPINARSEATFEEKYEAARKRVEDIAAWLKKQQPDAETVSTFDGRPKPDGSTEAEAIGRCVQQVLECDGSGRAGVIQSLMLPKTTENRYSVFTISARTGKSIMSTSTMVR